MDVAKLLSRASLCPNLLAGAGGFASFLPSTGGCASLVPSTGGCASLVPSTGGFASLVPSARLALTIAVAAGLVAVMSAVAAARWFVGFDAIAPALIGVTMPIGLSIVMAGVLNAGVLNAGVLNAGVLIARVLSPSIFGFAIEIGGARRPAALIVVRFDRSVEPFADRHAGSPCGLTRSLARFGTKASEIPRTARFHSRVQATS